MSAMAKPRSTNILINLYTSTCRLFLKIRCSTSTLALGVSKSSEHGSAAAMLPHDSMVANVAGQGNARVSVVARNSLLPQPSSRRQHSSSVPGLQGFGVASQPLMVPSSSGPRPIPTGAQRAAAAVLEAPTQASQHELGWVDLGYPRDIESKYEWGKELGKGGNGVVREVTNKETGEVFACKAIGKQPAGDVSEKKKAGHIDSIRRELEVLRRLSGSLNVVRLIDVYEDEQSVYVVQELCKGGELWHRIGERHYSERTVSLSWQRQPEHVLECCCCRECNCSGMPVAWTVQEPPHASNVV